MTKADVMHRLRSAGRALASELPGARLFVFGSLLLEDVWPADVDVLAVYSTVGDAQRIREVLQAFAKELPLHLMLLSESEEEELGFVTSERCVLLN